MEGGIWELKHRFECSRTLSFLFKNGLGIVRVGVSETELVALGVSVEEGDGVGEHEGEAVVDDVEETERVGEEVVVVVAVRVATYTWHLTPFN